MNANLIYSALKKTLGELTEVIDRAQPDNEEAGNLLKRMDLIVVDLETQLSAALSAHHITSAATFSVSN